jgi:hypothetical protein
MIHGSFRSSVGQAKVSMRRRLLCRRIHGSIGCPYITLQHRLVHQSIHHSRQTVDLSSDAAHSVDCPVSAPCIALLTSLCEVESPGEVGAEQSQRQKVGDAVRQRRSVPDRVPHGRNTHLPPADAALSATAAPDLVDTLFFSFF